MLLYKINLLKANIFSKKIKSVECSNDKTTWQFLSMDDAIAYPWIRLNSNACSVVFVVDIDPKQFDENTIKNALNVATPNYIINNPFKENSLQLGYILNRQIFKNSEEFKIFEQVKNVLYKLFNADLDNKNYKAKNPFSVWWDVQWSKLESYDLYELKNLVCAEKLQLKTDEKIDSLHFVEKQKNENYIYNANSSNCQNFDDLRLKGYEWIDTFKDSVSSENLATTLFNFLLNQANPQIYKHQTKAEIKATIKSIVRFCINDYKSETKGKFARANYIKKDKEMKAKEYIKTHYNVHEKFSKKQKEEIAQKLNLTDRTVTVYLAQLRKTVEKKEKTKVDIIVDYKEKNLLSFSEIAKLLNMSDSAVKKAYQRAKKSI